MNAGVAKQVRPRIAFDAEYLNPPRFLVMVRLTVPFAFLPLGVVTVTQKVAARPADTRLGPDTRVLVAGHDDCEQRVSGASVGPLEPVVVPVGTSDGYRASYPSHPRTAGLAILRTGTWLTLVEVGSRSGYPTRWDPARVALRRAARTF